MEKMGVAKVLRNAIFMPEFDDLRYTQSAQYWIIDAFAMRFGSLEGLTERIRNNMQMNQQSPYFLNSGKSLHHNSLDPNSSPNS